MLWFAPVFVPESSRCTSACGEISKMTFCSLNDRISSKHRWQPNARSTAKTFQIDLFFARSRLRQTLGQVPTKCSAGRAQRKPSQSSCSAVNATCFSFWECRILTYTEFCWQDSYRPCWDRQKCGKHHTLIFGQIALVSQRWLLLHRNNQGIGGEWYYIFQARVSGYGARNWDRSDAESAEYFYLRPKWTGSTNLQSNTVQLYTSLVSAVLRPRNDLCMTFNTISSSLLGRWYIILHAPSCASTKEFRRRLLSPPGHYRVAYISTSFSQWASRRRLGGWRCI